MNIGKIMKPTTRIKDTEDPISTITPKLIQYLTSNSKSIDTTGDDIVLHTTSLAKHNSLQSELSRFFNINSEDAREYSKVEDGIPVYTLKVNTNLLEDALKADILKTAETIKSILKSESRYKSDDAYCLKPDFGITLVNNYLINTDFFTAGAENLQAPALLWTMRAGILNLCQPSFPIEDDIEMNLAGEN